MTRCCFQHAAGCGRPGGCTCRATAEYRVWYCVDPETELTPDYRVYCRRHADRYAGMLRAMKCVTAVEVRALDPAADAAYIHSSPRLDGANNQKEQ